MTDATAPGVCRLCGRPVSEHNRHVRFRLPDPVLDTPDQERTPGTWMSHDTVEDSVLLQVPAVGPFIRCLLPVKLTGGYTVTFGVWLGAHPDDLQRAFRVWWQPDYEAFSFDGRLANRLPSWGCLAAPAHATVQNAGHTPYVTRSADPVLARVLAAEWPHEQVLPALPA
jgi:hypothetical protein